MALDIPQNTMAEITNQMLKMEKAGELMERATVTFQVAFTSREIRENIRFGLFMLLMERDEEFERYHKASNGVFSFCFSPFNLANNGNHICWFASKTVAPNGASHMKVEFSNEVITQEGPDGLSNHRVYIFVMPEVLCGQAWTNEVCVNYK